MRWWSRFRRAPRGLCRECGSTLHLQQIEEGRGTSGLITLRLKRLPVLACPNPDHPREYAHRDFGARLIDELFSTGQIPVARTGSTILSRPRCFRCGQKMPRTPGSTGEVVGPVSIEELPAFEVWIAGPTVFCDSCGSMQIAATEDIAMMVNGALINAFEALGLDS